MSFPRSGIGGVYTGRVYFLVGEDLATGEASNWIGGWSSGQVRLVPSAALDSEASLLSFFCLLEDLCFFSNLEAKEITIIANHFVGDIAAEDVVAEAVITEEGGSMLIPTQ